MTSENIKENKQGYKPLGFVLLNNIEFDIDFFLLQIKKHWNMEAIETHKSTEYNGMINLSFWLDGVKFICTLIPCPFPDNEAIEDSKLNYLWENAVDEVSGHKAIISVAIIENHCLEQIKTCIVFTKVCNALMLLPNTCAMYMSKQHLIIEPQQYRNTINIMKAAESHSKIFLPVENWVRIGIYQDESGYSGYTCGLKELNKLELEILYKDIEPIKIYQVLNMIVFNILCEDMNIQNGDIINLNEELEVIVKKSEGIFVEEETLKIIL
ncbi:DUF4261 domain-containing protein [Clostridium gasigenes]|uniref:DUF4261 domain-containing protein n=1 Tax=Clostridium gasigenes TaxID=94869 RepID=UPI001C0C619E|nr:DUF4261 domain-containing protein [Clostridium gasigenes]MBU3134610.1 DUF4261 domain-containing protein [Clostridium gasigenes]